VESTIDRIRVLVAKSLWRVSDHATEEMDEDGILPGDVLKGVELAQVVEDYPTSAKGPAVLVLEQDSGGRPLHVVWGIPAGAASRR
jgi:hypothetical protein